MLTICYTSQHMLKLSYTQKALTEAPKKYTRIILTEDSKDWHRMVESTDGTLEYRMGAGKWSDITHRTLRTLVRSIIQAAKSHQLTAIAIEITPTQFPALEEHSPAWLAQTIAENIILAGYEFKTYKTEPDTKKQLSEVLLCGALVDEATADFKRGEVIATYTNHARDIANTTGEHMTPDALAKATKKLASGTGVVVKVLDHTAIKKQKFGLLEAVGKGAENPPRFIVMEYNGGKKGEAPIVLIGKGVTFDTGGLNVKPAGSMHDMHLDMSGGATVAAAICAAGALKFKQNVVALIPAAENAISDRSMRAGDIVTSLSGKTVEILHTDAEGRLILADAYTYAVRYKPAVIIDVATLTGASLVALGQHASAILTKDEELGATLTALGEETGDYVWPLPLWDEYKQYLKSNRADVSNISTSFAKWGGCIEGATFLSFFAPKNTPWAHIDIAPRMDSIPSDKLAKGATGEPVRLLVAYIAQS